MKDGHNHAVEEITTVCDKCGDEVPQIEANEVEEGNEEVTDEAWQGSTLCDECYALLTEF